MSTEPQLEELRRAVAEIIGQDPDTWPSHGNAALAIASAVAVMAGDAAAAGRATRDLSPTASPSRPAAAIFEWPDPATAAAFEMGSKGAEGSDEERARFEAWMAGHCWACAPWTGRGYADQTTRVIWAAWRDRAALALSSQP